MGNEEEGEYRREKKKGEVGRSRWRARPEVRQKPYTKENTTTMQPGVKRESREWVWQGEYPELGWKWGRPCLSYTHEL